MHRLRQSRFVEACALDKNLSLINVSWCYYKLGMYRQALLAPLDKEDLKTYFSKTISAAYLGEREDSLYFLEKIKSKYPKELHHLIAPLATYFPECAFELGNQLHINTPIHYALHTLFEGKEQTIRKFGLILEKESQKNLDIALFYSNLTIVDNGKQLECLNNLFLNHGLRPAYLKLDQEQLSVNNLFCQPLLKPKPKSLNKSPLVSILVPAYNVEDRLRSSIESLVQQDYPNIEILIIDDASTDGTAEVIRGLEREYSQVKGIYLPVNVGPFVAKNYAAKKSDGEFMTTLDADDWAHPQRITQQIAPLLENNQLVATTCQWLRLDDHGQFYSKQHLPFVRFNPSSPMFRKKLVLEKTGLWDSVRMAADTEFIERLKLVFGRKKIYQIKKPLVVGAHRLDSLMTSNQTGNLVNKMSPTRLAYWESWRFWHIEQIRAGKLPKISTVEGYLPQFSTPTSMVNSESTLSVINKYMTKI